MKSILLIGDEKNNFTRNLKKVSGKKNIEIHLLKPSSFISNLKISIELNRDIVSPEIGSGKKKIDLKNLAAVFPCVANVILNKDGATDKDSIYKLRERSALYRGLLDCFNVPVINLIPPPYWSKKILYPPDLIRLCSKTNAIIPGFIISNDHEELRSFFEACRKHVVYFPGTQSSVFYTIDTDEKFSKLNALIKLMPVTLHELIKGDSHKVYVTGKLSFTSNLKKHQSPVLPDKILKDCIDLTETLGILFAEFEIIENDNNYYLTSISLIPELKGCSDQLAAEIINGIFKSIEI